MDPSRGESLAPPGMLVCSRLPAAAEPRAGIGTLFTGALQEDAFAWFDRHRKAHA